MLFKFAKTYDTIKTISMVDKQKKEVNYNICDENKIKKTAERNTCSRTHCHLGAGTGFCRGRTDLSALGGFERGSAKQRCVQFVRFGSGN